MNDDLKNRIKELLPLSVSELEAKTGIWPPSLFTDLENTTVLLMVESRDVNPQSRIVLELCPHQALGIARNICAVMGDRINLPADMGLSLKLMGSVFSRMIDDLPACGNDAPAPTATKPLSISEFD